MGSVPRLGRSPGEGKGYPLQGSDLKNSMDSIVHGITKNCTPEELSLPSFLVIPEKFMFSLNKEVNIPLHESR